MNKLKFIVKEILFPASFLFTLFNIFAYIVEYTETDNSAKLKSFALVLVYFIIISIANKIFRTELSTFAKVLIHYGCVVGVLSVGVMVMGNDNAVGGIFMVGTIVYAVIATPVLIIRSVIKRKANEEKKYESSFGKTK